MPGYNVTGPGEAFSGALEDYLRRQADEREMRLRAEQHRQSIALQQQQLAQQRGEFEQRTKDSTFNRALKFATTVRKNDILGPDQVGLLREAGMDHLVAGPTEVQGIDPSQLQPGTAEQPQVGMGPPTSGPFRFAGLPAENEREKQRAERVQYIQSLPEGPLRVGAQMHETLGMTPSGPMLGIAGASGTDFGRFLAQSQAESGQPLSAEQMLEARKKYTSAGRAGAESTLAPDAIDMEAWRNITKGTTPNARSVGGPGNYQAIADRMSAIRKEYGLPANLANNEATYKGLSTALTNQMKLAEAAKTAARTAEDNLELARQASPAVTRTDSAFVNRVINEFIREGTSAAPLTDFEVKIYTAAREYAKVVSGSSASVQGLSDSATQEAVKLLNSAQSPEALNAAIDAMKADMGNFIDNYDRTVDDIQGRFDQIGKASRSRTPRGGSALDQPATGLPADWWQTHGGR